LTNKLLRVPVSDLLRAHKAVITLHQFRVAVYIQVVIFSVLTFLIIFHQTDMVDNNKHSKSNQIETVTSQTKNTRS